MTKDASSAVVALTLAILAFPAPLAAQRQSTIRVGAHVASGGEVVDASRLASSALQHPVRHRSGWMRPAGLASITTRLIAMPRTDLRTDEPSRPIPTEAIVLIEFIAN